MNMNCRRTLITIENVIVAVLCILAIFLNIWGVRYDTNDDMIIALSDYDYWRDVAERQGRVSYYLAGPLAMLPHFLNDIYYLTAVRMISLLLLISSAAALMARLLKSRGVFTVYVLVVSLLWSNSLNGHNFLVSYPGYIALTSCIFIYALTLFVNGARYNSRRDMALASVFLLLALVMGGEIYFQYLPLLIFGLFYFYRQANSKRDFIPAFYLVGSSIGVALLIVISFRIAFPSQYSGNSELNFDFDIFSQTFLVLTAGLFPGVQPFLNRAFLFTSPVAIGVAIAISISAVVAIVLMRERMLEMKLTTLGAKEIKLGSTAFVIAVFVPNILVSLVVKYQEWVLLHNTTNYLYSALSYIPFALMGGFLLVVCAKNKRVYLLVTAVIGGLVFFTQLNNFYVSGLQRANSEKWDLFDAAIQRLKSEANGKPIAISLSDSFFVGIPQESYWENYAHKKLEFSGQVRRGGNADRHFSYYPSASHGALLFVGSEGLIEDAFGTFSCDETNPCFLLTSNAFGKNLIKSGRGGSAVSLMSEGRVERVHSYRLTNRISEDSILGLSFHEFHGRLQNEVALDFGSGVYDLEGREGGYWRWVRVPATLVVDSKSRQKVLVDLVLTPASDMVVEARLNDFESSYSLRGGATQEIQFTATLEEGKNELLFESAVKPIRLNKSDPRFFSFMINSVKIHANEN